MNINAAEMGSSFLASIQYRRMAKEVQPQHPKQGWLLVTLKRGVTYAYLVPTWIPGLLVAGIRKGETAGEVYNRLVKGKYAQIKAEGDK